MTQDIEDIITKFKNRSILLEPEKKEKIYNLVEYLHNSITNEISWRQYSNILEHNKKKFKATARVAELRYIYDIFLKNEEKKPNLYLLKHMKKYPCRSQSGVIVITVFTAPFPEYIDSKGNHKKQRFSCKYDCYYCPAEPGQPRSYVKDGPSTRRANDNDFDPVKQFYDRAIVLKNNGHDIDKIELLILGGTWSSNAMEYRDWFIRQIYYSANMFYEKKLRKPLSLDEELKLNENSKCHIIGITIETRPDCITIEEVQSFRRQGVTRVQMGAQHTDDSILKKVNRGCYQKDIINSIKFLKDCGYKVDGHWMPDLCSTPEQDRKMFETLLYNPDYQLDQYKIYPLEVTDWTILKKWWEEGKHVPQTEEQLFENIKYLKTNAPEYWRFNRIGRDIPSKSRDGKQYIYAGNPHMNLRQIVQIKMKNENKFCKCIRCKEPKGRDKNINDAELVIRKYEASQGTEYFLSYESPDRKIIYGFLRLRITNNERSDIFPELKNCALIRELHVYGLVVKVNEDSLFKTSQHIGFGSKLMNEAENIAISNNKWKIAVISGVGVRNYYRKLGYELQNTYMIKELGWWDYITSFF